MLSLIHARRMPSAYTRVLAECRVDRHNTRFPGWCLTVICSDDVPPFPALCRRQRFGRAGAVHSQSESEAPSTRVRCKPQVEPFGGPQNVSFFPEQAVECEEQATGYEGVNNGQEVPCDSQIRELARVAGSRNW